MPTLSVPPEQIPIERWISRLRDMAKHDLPKARQAALLRLIWQESHLTQAGLMARVEDLLRRGCFGPNPGAAFQADIAVVRQVLADAGHQLQLTWGDEPKQTTYYIKGRPLLDEQLQKLIAGAIAEVDQNQIAISRRLTPAQQFRQGISMTRLAEQVASYRLLQRQPHLSPKESRRIVRERSIKKW